MIEYNESEFLVETEVPEDEVKYQKLYDKMRSDANERIRKIIYE